MSFLCRKKITTARTEYSKGAENFQRCQLPYAQCVSDHFEYLERTAVVNIYIDSAKLTVSSIGSKQSICDYIS